MKTILKTISYILCIVLFLSGLVCALAGIASGFGNPSLQSKVMWVFVGTAAIVVSVFLMYLTAGRKWKTLLDDLAMIAFLSS